MSIIFYHNDEQRTLALASRQREEAGLGQKVFTEIVPFSGFYLAEDYHQKYYLQLEPDLMKELSAIYEVFSDFRDSTAAARINGYLGGNGDFKVLQEQLNSLGLSEAGNEKLLELGRQLLHSDESTETCPIPAQ